MGGLRQHLVRVPLNQTNLTQRMPHSRRHHHHPHKPSPTELTSCTLPHQATIHRDPRSGAQATAAWHRCSEGHLHSQTLVLPVFLVASSTLSFRKRVAACPLLALNLDSPSTTAKDQTDVDLSPECVPMASCPLLAWPRADAEPCLHVCRCVLCMTRTHSFSFLLARSHCWPTTTHARNQTPPTFLALSWGRRATFLQRAQWRRC